jgi:hypothetical protein
MVSRAGRCWAAGGVLAGIVAAQTRRRALRRMVDFFQGVGTPTARLRLPRKPGSPGFRGRQRKRAPEGQAAKRGETRCSVLDHDRAGGYWGASMPSRPCAACGS